MVLLFKFGQAFQEIFYVVYLKKLGFFWIRSGIYEGHLNTGMAPKRLFFLFYSEITLEKLTYFYNLWSGFQKQPLILFEISWATIGKLFF